MHYDGQIALFCMELEGTRISFLQVMLINEIFPIWCLDDITVIPMLRSKFSYGVVVILIGNIALVSGFRNMRHEKHAAKGDEK